MWRGWEHVVGPDGDVNGNDSDEDMATALGLSLLSDPSIIPTARRFYQLKRWLWCPEFSTYLRRRLQQTRRCWAWIICKAMRQRQRDRRRLLALKVQHARLRSIAAFEQFWMVILYKHIDRLPLRIKILIVEFLIDARSSLSLI